MAPPPAEYGHHLLREQPKHHLDVVFCLYCPMYVCLHFLLSTSNSEASEVAEPYQLTSLSFSTRYDPRYAYNIVQHIQYHACRFADLACSCSIFPGCVHRCHLKRSNATKAKLICSDCLAVCRSSHRYDKHILGTDHIITSLLDRGNHVHGRNWVPWSFSAQSRCQ